MRRGRYTREWQAAFYTPYTVAEPVAQPDGGLVGGERERDGSGQRSDGFTFSRTQRVDGALVPLERGHQGAVVCEPTHLAQGGAGQERAGRSGQAGRAGSGGRGGEGGVENGWTQAPPFCFWTFWGRP